MENQSIYKDYTGGYIYPPRAEETLPPEDLKGFDGNDRYFAQPKLDGSCAVLMIEPGGQWHLYNRHRQPLTGAKPLSLASLNPYPDSHMVLTGEYLNKNKVGENGPLNHVLVIWDVLVIKGRHLLGSTAWERQDYLKGLYGTDTSAVRPDGTLEMYEYLHPTFVPGVYLARTMHRNGSFEEHYKALTKFPLYEGLVIKRTDGRLRPGTTSTNNGDWQVKCRRATKNYRF